MSEFYGYCMAHYGPPITCRCEKCTLKAASDRIAELEAKVEQLERENERLREAAQKRADCGHDDECGGRVGNTCGCGHTELEAALENNNE